jgi:hypothetical protein
VPILLTVAAFAMAADLVWAEPPLGRALREREFTEP